MYNSQVHIYKHTLSWSISSDFRETITAVIVLPVVSSNQNKSKKSSNVAPEWTCIAVGFSSGFIRFYTDVRLHYYDYVCLLKGFARGNSSY